jgi:thiol-disulfide isomerase/thioredoxin
MPQRTATIIAVAALAVASMSPTARAQGPDSYYSGFEPSGDWLLAVDGQAQPKARIFDVQRGTVILILSSEFDSPVLVQIADRSVSTVDLMKVANRSDGTIDLLADAVLERVGSFTIEGQDEAHFAVQGKQVVLKRNPWLLGPHTGEELLTHSAAYKWRANRYEPIAEAISKLRGERRKVRVLTFFGSWCPHCKEHVPLLLKVEERLADSRIRFDYYGLPSPFGDEPQATKWGVQAVPTTIVFLDDKEIGRIPDSGWSNPETALEVILHPPKG